MTDAVKAPKAQSVAKPATLSSFAALASTLGTVEAESASAVPTIDAPAKIGSGRSVGCFVDGDSLVIVMNIAEARIAGLVPRMNAKTGQPSKSVTIAEAGGFRPIPLGFRGLKLNLWLGRDKG